MTEATLYNLEAEQSVLGCILIDQDTAAEIIPFLTEVDFYVESHKFILGAVKAVYNNRKPLDLVTISDTLSGMGKLEDVGGISYITELMQITPSAANYKHYIDIVKRDSLNRKLTRAAREIAEYAGTSPEDALQFAENKIYGISQAQDTSTVVDIRQEGFYDVLDKFNAIENNKDAFRGVMTGFFRLDKLTNGLQQSDLIVIAARPGMGKTSLAMNIVEHAAVYGNKTCAVFSMEMPTLQIKQRLICSNANVSMSAALSGKLSDKEWQRLAAAQARMNKSAVYIDDSARITPAEILSKCRRFKAKDGRLDLVMVDYIQLMSSGKKGDENRTLEVASITRELKQIAKELQVPVIALSQLRRLKDGERSQLSDLRESGAIEQDADIVMFIDRPDVNASDEEIIKKGIVKGAAELRIAKHRNGELGTLPLRFKGETTKFVDAEIEK
ncbi:MAG: replicative DNA helicase [Clostridia bacterium]|jgi:replicative DNA helicase|nr:replicative DNA helicase [Clostridia bacterium]